jgi:phosphatidylinositol glycan class U
LVREHPLFAVVVMTGIIATFKSYPSVGDIAFFHSLLALYPEIVPRTHFVFFVSPSALPLGYPDDHPATHPPSSDMRHPLLSVALMFYSACLLPAFHHLWLYAGSGNSNFFYASTLVWGIANGLTIVDALWAYLKREFLRQSSLEGREGLVVVQK